jgi:hypothetical protein
LSSTHRRTRRDADRWPQEEVEELPTALNTVADLIND